MVKLNMITLSVNIMVQVLIFQQNHYVHLVVEVLLIMVIHQQIKIILLLEEVEVVANRLPHQYVQNY